jgi:hypothetical protein
MGFLVVLDRTLNQRVRSSSLRRPIFPSPGEFLPLGSSVTPASEQKLLAMAPRWFQPAQPTSKAGEGGDVCNESPESRGLVNPAFKSVDSLHMVPSLPMIQPSNTAEPNGIRLPEGNDGNGTRRSECSTMYLETLDLMKGVRCKICFSAMRTAHHGNVLNHQQAGTSAVAARHTARFHAFLATNIADQFRFRSHGPIRDTS